MSESHSFAKGVVLKKTLEVCLSHSSLFWTVGWTRTSSGSPCLSMRRMTSTMERWALMMTSNPWSKSNLKYARMNHNSKSLPRRQQQLLDLLLSHPSRKRSLALWRRQRPRLRHTCATESRPPNPPPSNRRLQLWAVAVEYSPCPSRPQRKHLKAGGHHPWPAAH